VTTTRWPRRAVRIGACAVALLGGGALLSCVSERATGITSAAGSCGVQLPAEAFGSTVVAIRDFAFAPAAIRVRPGTTVTWVSCEPTGTEPHTSTSDTGVWSSPLLVTGSTNTQTFDAAGSYPYHCTLHPGMRGTVTVE
jgi:plastocyanin